MLFILHLCQPDLRHCPSKSKFTGSAQHYLLDFLTLKEIMNDTITITLRKPVTIGELKFENLNLQEPTAGQLEKASNGVTSSVGVVINLISAVAVVPRKVAESLCQRDFQEASDFLNSFNDLAPSTGETLLPN
jgi:hypothetical protein